MRDGVCRKPPGGRSKSKRYDPTLLNAPVVILILEDERAINAGGTNVGICGQNMNLVANSLGLGVCWVRFATAPRPRPRVGESQRFTVPSRSVDQGPAP
ncbi:MAG TPA: nitroreductase family protein [Dehalococcoidia bacterium]|nr:nitroreductase family protein [Dehalococcoidia bacterium]